MTTTDRFGNNKDTSVESTDPNKNPQRQRRKQETERSRDITKKRGVWDQTDKKLHTERICTVLWWLSSCCCCCFLRSPWSNWWFVRKRVLGSLFFLVVVGFLRTVTNRPDMNDFRYSIWILVGRRKVSDRCVIIT